MVEIDDLVRVVKSDAMLGRTIEGARENDTLREAGFDSLDVMMVAHLLGTEYGLELEISGDSTLAQVAEQIESELAARRASADRG